MQHYTIQGCTNCGSLREIYDEIECTLIDLIKRKWTNVQYNTSLTFNQTLFDDLVRYKRVVFNRMYNPSYPSSTISTQDIISQVKLRVYKSGCTQCTDCFPPEDSTSTSTTSSTSTTTID